MGALLVSCSVLPAAAATLTQVYAALAAGQDRQAETLATTMLAEPDLAALVQHRMYVARALALEAQGRGEDALADFTLALSGAGLPPAERARALYDRGVALDGLGRLADALGDYDAALELDPRASYALNNRANIYRRLGRPDEARRDYLAALAMPGAAAQYPYYGLGQIAESQGDAAAARDYYSKAAAADPGYRLALDRLAALGASGFTPAQETPSDGGIIVLHPPRPLVLRPPHSSDAPKTAAASPPFHPAIQAMAAPGGGAPLRPAIVDGLSRQKGAFGMVQLGAWRSAEEAGAGWRQALAGAPELLKGLPPVIVAADLPGRGRYYRLRVQSREPEAKFCAALTAVAVACMPARD